MHNCGIPILMSKDTAIRSTLDLLTLLDTHIGKAFASNSYVTAILFNMAKAYNKKLELLDFKRNG